MNVDQAGIGRVLVAPHLAEQLLAGEDLPRRASQSDQQLELQRSQGDDRVAALDLVTGDVDVEVTGAHVLGRPGVGTAQTGRDAGQQLLGLEGLGHVVVSPGLQTGNDVLGVGPRGQHNDRHVGL